jgi:hypothetical protein
MNHVDENENEQSVDTTNEQCNFIFYIQKILSFKKIF